MILTIYNNKSDKRVVNKSIEPIAQLDNLQMREDFDVRNGSVEVDTLTGCNLWDGVYTANRYIDDTGVIRTSNNYNLSSYIPVNGDFVVSYTPSTSGPDQYAYYSLFNLDKIFIERVYYDPNDGLIIGNHTGFIRINFYKPRTPAGTQVMVNAGTEALPYQPYGTYTDISRANYCYINDLNRYYYITDVTADGRRGRWRLDLKCDVLMTFASGIRSLSGTVDRQQNKYNGYIPDGEYKQLAYSQITAKAFPNAMNNDTLILMTVG